MGKSRSATVTCAFLMQRYGITPGQALAQIRETRPFCEPNDGFMKQLELYHRMAEADDIEQSPVYQRWLYQREIEMSRACGQAPEAEKIRFEDEHESQGTADFELKCKKCRYVLLDEVPLSSSTREAKCSLFIRPMHGGSSVLTIRPRPFSRATSGWILTKRHMNS